MSPADDVRWPDLLVVASERRGSDHRLVVSGDIRLASAPLLERELLRVEHTDAETVTIDLSEPPEGERSVEQLSGVAR